MHYTWTGYRFANVNSVCIHVTTVSACIVKCNKYKKKSKNLKWLAQGM